MTSADFDRDEALRAKTQRPAERGPQAGTGDASANILSALGNATVQRLFRSSLQREGDSASGAVDDEIANSIQSERGTGQGLDDAARRDLEPAFGEDFSDVRVHTDSKADSLNRAVSAEAFTTGRDIFFRHGSYNPGSADGQKLLAHELTHVVQQRNAPPAQDLTVSDPSDESELQAGHVADSVSGGGGEAAVARQEVPEDEEEAVQTSAIERADTLEEEEEVMTSPLQREGEMLEEEEMQMSPLQREVDMPEEEEEELQTSRVQREASIEEQPDKV
jgi:hypothetical protein